MDAQSRAELRNRLYSMCSCCAELIVRQETKRSQRYLSQDVLVHVPENHGLWLEILGIIDEL